MKKTVAFLLILAVCLSLCSCAKTDEETSASLNDTVVDTVQDGAGESEDSQPTSDDAAQKPADINQSTDKTNETEKTENVQNTDSSSEETLYKVAFDFGYSDLIVVKEFKDIVESPVTDRDGFIFDGWYNGETKWDFEKDRVTSDITLKAKWTPRKYSITYVKGDATLPENYPTEFTPLTETIELEPATKEGRIFVGWEIRNGNSTIISTQITKGTVGDLILVPVWDENLITLGTYKQDKNGQSKTPIVWQKLGEKDGKALFITKDIIDAGVYNSVTGSHIRWESCELRKWLNGSFYNTAFTSAEKEKILLSKLSTPGEYDGSETEDYVFALSYEEAGEYMEKYEDRQAAVTDYAASQGATVGEGYGWWWLRTKVNDKKAAMVENIGKRQIVGYEVKVATIGIRPAIWVDVSKL